MGAVVSIALTPAQPDRFRTYALVVLLAAFAWRCGDVLAVLRRQPAGVDYAAFWAGAKAALSDPGRVYDFAHVTALQGWPFGPGVHQPFSYPPSALLVFAPLSALPYWVGYGLWVAATFGLMAWAGRRAGARWWIALFPAVWLVAVAGQATFLIGGLVLAALTLRRRPLVAGALLGAAAAVKPQLLIFAPLALVATRDWRALAAAGATGLGACALSAGVWGTDLWTSWLQALPRFQAEVFAQPRLTADAITPYAMLAHAGAQGGWAFLLAPVAASLVWITFRRTEAAADRSIALFAAALAVSPYAMNYEAALFAPAVAAYLARTDDRLWPLYATAACLYTMGLVHGATPVVAALVLLVSSLARRQRSAIYSAA